MDPVYINVHNIIENGKYYSDTVVVWLIVVMS